MENSCIWTIPPMASSLQLLKCLKTGKNTDFHLQSVVRIHILLTQISLFFQKAEWKHGAHAGCGLNTG